MIGCVVAIAVAACGGGAGPAAVGSPSVLTGALSQGLIAYLADQGVGVLDPATGKSTIVAPMPAGAAFRVAGPVWGPAPGVAYPVLYFTIHDDRPAERRTTAGVVPYDWIFRVDPFTGTIQPIAASQDSQSEGPIGLVANSHYVALSVGCCASYEVDALDVTQPLSAIKVLSKPPTQAAFFTEGAAPGVSGLLAVREFGTGTWYWLNADAGVLNPFPLTLGPDDGPIAISPDGTLAAVSLPDKGAVIEPINSGIPLATPSSSSSASASAPATASPHPSPTPSASNRRAKAHQLGPASRRRPRLEPRRQADRAGGEWRARAVRLVGRRWHASDEEVPHRRQRHRGGLVGSDAHEDGGDAQSQSWAAGDGRCTAHRDDAAGSRRHSGRPP